MAVKRKRGSDDPIDALKKCSLEARQFFLQSYGVAVQPLAETKTAAQLLKVKRGYGTTAKSLPSAAGSSKPAESSSASKSSSALQVFEKKAAPTESASRALQAVPAPVQKEPKEKDGPNSRALLVQPRKQTPPPKPQWHAPWKLHRVIAGHMGWVRSIAVDHSNEWFASAGNDRTVKIWDLATGQLKLTLPKHIHAIRALAISSRSPYLFTAAEDKQVLCWDLEANRVVRSYHGHLSGVYSMALYDQLDILATGGRDSSVRVWDIRTKTEIHTLTGHKDAVASLEFMPEPVLISGSQDNQIRIWDIAEGKGMATLTHHKKGVRALKMHPTEHTFCSGAADNVKKWKCPRGEFLNNFSGHKAIVNTVGINHDNVMVSGDDDGQLKFWDWKTGYNFQTMQTVPQAGSLDCERAIYSATFDQSGARLLTGEADKTIKIWKEDETATEESHPIEWNPDLSRHY